MKLSLNGANDEGKVGSGLGNTYDSFQQPPLLFQVLCLFRLLDLPPVSLLI
jgi:hypothetical protein